MPGSDETFQRIQREISEVIQREKELKSNYYIRSQSAPLDQNISLTSNGSSCNEDSSSSCNEEINTCSKPHLTSVIKESKSGMENHRLFKPNTTNIKGVMHRFIKSRGKVHNVSPIVDQTNNNRSNSWTNSTVFEPAKVPLQSGKSIRNGFVPVEERIRREFEEMHVRETELRSERRKSQPDLMAIFDVSSSPPERFSLRSAKSFTHLNDLEDYTELTTPPSLKSARSLAELCDVENEDELHTPTSLIRQWESIIQKNQKINK